MRTALGLLVVQGVLGAVDTLYFHEWKLRLPARSEARRELGLHAARDFAYALLFGTISWVTWDGALAVAFLGILAAEIGLTLADFLEEDRTRRLPAGERVMHAIMGIVYGAFLAAVLPEVARWLTRATGFTRMEQGPFAWILGLMAVGVFVSGIRDLLCALRLPRTGRGLS